MLLTDIPNLETLAISSIFAFVFLLIMNIITGGVRDLKKYSIKNYEIMYGLGFLGLFLYSALYYYGLAQFTSQEACILNYLWPIMLVIFSSIILKEKMTVAKSLAIAGMLSCIVAAACYGLFSALNKKADYNQNIAMMVIWLGALSLP